MEFVGGVVRLPATEHIDNSTTEASDSTISDGTKNGVTYGTLNDGSTLGLKLGSDGTCDGRSADCAKTSAPEIYELHSSWTPKWNNIVHYFKFTGTGSASNGDTVAATVGSPGTVSDANNSKISYANAKTGTGMVFDGVDDEVNFSTVALGTGNFAASAWVHIPSLPNRGAFIQIGQSCSGVGFGIGNTTFETFGSQLIILYEGITWYSSGYTFLSPGTYHVAMSINSSSQAVLYVNGKRIAGTFTGYTPYSIGAGCTSKIGGYYTVPYERHFNGIIDELAIWNTTLTDANVSEIYTHQEAANSGVFTSRVMDGLNSTSTWRTSRCGVLRGNMYTC
jgi:Concanavalin A-like lectin/glucanases superfamily